MPRHKILNYDYLRANCLRSSQTALRFKLIGPAVLELLIKACKILFSSITQEPHDLLIFQYPFFFSFSKILLQDVYIFFSKKYCSFQENAQLVHTQFWFGMQFPLEKDTAPVEMK